MVLHPQLAQHVQGTVHVGVVHIDDRPVHLDLGKIAQLDFREDLEGGDEGAILARGEAGIAGHGQVVGLHGRAELLLQGIAQDLAANLAGIAGGHQLHGRLAGTETIHAHIPGDLRQALANFGLHLLLIEVESDTAVEAFEGFHGCCHQVFLKRRYIYPGSCGSRQGMARLVRSGRLELPRLGRQNLNLVRLPIPPRARQRASVNYPAPFPPADRHPGNYITV